MDSVKSFLGYYILLVKSVPLHIAWPNLVFSVGSVSCLMLPDLGGVLMSSWLLPFVLLLDLHLVETSELCLCCCDCMVWHCYGQLPFQSMVEYGMPFSFAVCVCLCMAINQTFCNYWKSFVSWLCQFLFCSCSSMHWCPVMSVVFMCLAFLTISQLTLASCTL